ncbi:hypothetical protein [Hyalangium versicolor]|uniref:hypothetical protein n=1 Tax=Hyalangium versicolor TaxID=2861190 RepID=UPI001CCE5DDD|nr:hypothetical protein [Hyalangium versicolor]
MQLRNTVMMLTALSALSVVMTACGDDTTTSTSCSSDADCSGTEDVCHPTGKFCVQSCTAAADCPATEKTCAPFTGASKNICQCSTDQLCNGVGSTSTDLVCSTVDKVCVERCTSDASCGTGRTCNTGTGQCSASGPKACTPACTGNQVCDTSTGTCVNNGATCSGEGQSTCAYGSQYCGSGTCQALPAPTCQNYTNFTNKSSLGTTGTIIYKATVDSSTTDTAYCGSTNPKRVKIALSAYSSTPFPQTKQELSGFFYVVVEGTQDDAVKSVSTSAGNYTVSGTNRERAEIVYSLCRPANSTTTSTGFYFVNGNFLCFQADYL